MKSKVSPIGETLLRKIDKIETEQLAFLSLFVFLLLTTFMTMMDLVSFNRLTSILSGEEVWDFFGADNNDDGIPMYRALFLVEPEQDAVIPKLNRLSFVVVIGQIVHMTNVRLLEYKAEKILKWKKGLLMGGIGLYLLFFLWMQGNKYEIAWVLAIQFFMLAYLGLSFTIIFAVSHIALSKDNTIGDQIASVESATESQNTEDESENQRAKNDRQEKKPRIRSPRN